MLKQMMNKQNKIQRSWRQDQHHQSINLTTKAQLPSIAMERKPVMHVPSVHHVLYMLSICVIP